VHVVDTGRKVGPAVPVHPITGEKRKSQPRKRTRSYPVSLLAEQSVRPVEELIGWIEQGKLKAFRAPTGEWMVSDLETWRELVNEAPKTRNFVHRLSIDVIESDDGEPQVCIATCLCGWKSKPRSQSLVREDWRNHAPDLWVVR
jgi:hypothetical protein